MAKTTFTGPVISKKGFINTGPANVVDADTSQRLIQTEEKSRDRVGSASA